MGTLSVGLALIAKNEEKNLPRLLASIEGAFDRVVLLDTGSTDKTKEVFQRWAKAQAGMTFSVADFEWIHDFAAARNAADNLLCSGTKDIALQPGMESAVDWKCWADCDDTIIGAEVIRDLCAQAPPELAAFVCGYDYAQFENGACVCHLRRERIVRAGAAEWVGRVHEAQVVNGPSTLLPDSMVQWKHHKQASVKTLEEAMEVMQGSNERNLTILRKWADDEPTNPRVLGYMGTELAVRGDHEEALGWFERYLAADPQWDEERAQVHRKLSCSLLVTGDVDGAENSALRALTVVPSWPDSYLTLAEVAYRRGQFAKAIEWAQRVQDIGAPDTLLIINPLEYEHVPPKLKAAAHGELGQWDQAVAEAQKALALFPDEQLRFGLMHYQAQAKREHTAQTYVMAAQQLVAHDEQLKARTLLEECVPHFAVDHPDVVALRSQVRERLSWLEGDYVDHYQTGGSKPEDFHSDKISDQIAQQLPRVKWLIGGLQEQIEAAA